MNTMSNILFPNSRMLLLGLRTISISVCSGRAGAVPGRSRVSGRSRVPGTGSGSGPVAGSKGCEREVSKVSVSMGSKTIGCVPEVWTEAVLGTGFREPEVLRRFRVPDIPFPRFRRLLCTSEVYFCAMNVHSYSCTVKV